MKILLADDNEYNRVVVIDTLKSKADVEIVEAVNGKEVLELLNEKDYDVVLMDVQMPELDGYEATREIRNAEFGMRNVPIIALTASVIRTNLDKCKAAGMNSYVPKPFTTSQLINAIAEVTGRTRARQTSHNSTRVSDQSSSNFKSQTSNSIDLSYLKNFCEGNEERMRKYITMFIEAIPDFQSKIEKAISENDFKEIAREVHAMKPRFMMMGMKEAQSLSSKIEQDIAEEKTGNVIAGIHYLQTLCEQSRSELRA